MPTIMERDSLQVYMAGVGLSQFRGRTVDIATTLITATFFDIGHSLALQWFPGKMKDFSASMISIRVLIASAGLLFVRCLGIAVSIRLRQRALVRHT